MAIKTYGTNYFFVEVFYYDADGNFCQTTEQYQSEDNALEKVRSLRDRIGEMYYSADWCGRIDSAYLFKAKLCRID